MPAEGGFLRCWGLVAAMAMFLGAGLTVWVAAQSPAFDIVIQGGETPSLQLQLILIPGVPEHLMRRD